MEVAITVAVVPVEVVVVVMGIADVLVEVNIMVVVWQIPDELVTVNVTQYSGDCIISLISGERFISNR